jgi:hypothetical protein
MRSEKCLGTPQDNGLPPPDKLRNLSRADLRSFRICPTRKDQDAPNLKTAFLCSVGNMMTSEDAWSGEKDMTCHASLNRFDLLRTHVSSYCFSLFSPKPQQRLWWILSKLSMLQEIHLWWNDTFFASSHGLSHLLLYLM